MEFIDKIIKLLVPAFVFTKIFRFMVTLHPAITQYIVKHTTRPSKSQEKYIHRICNEFWEGALIMPDIGHCDTQAAIKRLQNADIVIFNIHGGGFRAGNCTMFMSAYIYWIEAIKRKYNLDACIMSIEYGLAPKHVYPGPLLQCMKAFKHLICDLHVPPSKIVVCGDSAGGCLTLETLIRTYAPSILMDLHAPRTNFDFGIPAGALLISPLVSSKCSSKSWSQFENSDIVTKRFRQCVMDEYIYTPGAKEEDLHLLRLHLVKKNFLRFLPRQVMCFVGLAETMHDDIVELTDAIGSEATHKITMVKEELPHDWFLMQEVVPRRMKYLIDKYNDQVVDFIVHAVDSYREDVPGPLSPCFSAISDDTDIPDKAEMKEVDDERHNKCSKVVDAKIDQNNDDIYYYSLSKTFSNIFEDKRVSYLSKMFID